MLLVEDEKDSLEVLATIFFKKFPNVALHTAGNGRTGLELFKEHMPEMSGLQMIDRNRTIKPDTKFTVLTGDTGKLVLQDSIGKGLK